MAAPQYVTVAAGQTVSSAFTLTRADRALVLGVASCAALGWWVEFAETPTGPFAPLNLVRQGIAVTSMSGGGWLMVGEFVPTSIGRVAVSGAIGATTSVAILETPK